MHIHIPRTLRRPRHIVDTWYDTASADTSVLQVWAYTTRMSWRAGETVGLHVSTTAETFDLEVGRDGLDYVPCHRETGLKGTWHETPDDCSAEGCDWPVSWRFRIPESWRPGGYVITVSVRSAGNVVDYHHVILIGSPRGEDAPPLLLLAATPTWVAYNDWGGSNAYDGITGAQGDRFSPRLSTQRPWSRGFVKLPPGAPRTLPERPFPAGTAARYPHKEWAWSHGYSKKYASAGWASYERHMARWLEKEGHAVDFATLHDIDAEPDLIVSRGVV